MVEYVQLKVGNNHTIANIDAQLRVQHTRNVVGSFYEALAAHVFTAVRWTGGEVYVRERDRRAVFNGPHPPCLVPDLVRRHDATFIESKGGNYHSQFKIYKWQAELYDALRRRAMVPIYRPRVEYAIFMHGLTSMTKSLGTARRLIAELAQNTMCCILVDLDVVLGFDKWVGTVEYGSEDHGRQYYPPFYPISSRYLRVLRNDPRTCLAQMGLEPFRFSVINREMDTGVFVDGTEINGFPIMEIKRKRGRRRGYNGMVDESWLTKISQREIFTRGTDVLGDLASEIDYQVDDDQLF
jgi:hypothetical protein